MPGAFKLDHLHPVEPILFSKFYNFFTFILGGQFLLPQRANNEKREFTQLQKWTRQRACSSSLESPTHIAVTKKCPHAGSGVARRAVPVGATHRLLIGTLARLIAPPLNATSLSALHFFKRFNITIFNSIKAMTV